MKSIDELRKELDDIDKEMSILFEKRLDCVSHIALIKKQYDLPIFDSNREKEVIESNIKNVDYNYQTYYLEFINNILYLSKEYQKSLLNNNYFNETYIIKKGSINNVEKYFNLNRKVLIITDDNIPKKYYERIIDKAFKAYVYIIPHGEKSKSFENYKLIIDYMINNNFIKSDCIVSCGGGVVSDISGLIASTYMRGIDLYSIPTSLLAQVDACLGGKTAIDFNDIKNIVGTFYFPKKVLIDINTLFSLNEREFYSGLVEAIKIGMTCDKELFELIENSSDIKNDIERIVFKSLKNKFEIVSKDEKDNNVRKVLNFGHTIGHSIEAMDEYSMLHGECVGIGMLYFSNENVRRRIINVLKKYNLPYKHNYSKEELYKKIVFDKKRNGNNFDIIFVNDIGSYEIKKINIDDIINYL